LKKNGKRRLAKLQSYSETFQIEHVQKSSNMQLCDLENNYFHGKHCKMDTSKQTMTPCVWASGPQILQHVFHHNGQHRSKPKIILEREFLKEHQDESFE